MRLVLCLTFLLWRSLLTQAAEFYNLNFEAANTNNVVGGKGLISDLLPGWQVYLDGGQVSLDSGQLSTAYPLNGPTVALHFPAGITNVGVGRFSVSLLPVFSLGPPFTFSSTSLRQTGSIAADATIIRFLNYGLGITLRVNGVTIPISYTEIGTVHPFRDVLYTGSGDISAFAGQTVEVDFVAIPRDGRPTFAFIDDIQLVPEPRPSIILLLVGGTFCFYSVRRGFGLRERRTSD